MPFQGVKISDDDLNSWLNSKKNKSHTIKEALKLYRQTELNDKEGKTEEITIPRTKGRVIGVKI